MFLDRSYVWQPRHGEPPGSDLTSQFKLYYQFLKHAFGLRYLPLSADGDGTEIMIALDRHSSQQHTDRLVDFAEKLPRNLGRDDLFVRIGYHNSANVLRLQVCDLLMGAAGSYGNQMHKKKEGWPAWYEPQTKGTRPFVQTYLQFFASD